MPKFTILVGEYITKRYDYEVKIEASSLKEARDMAMDSEVYSAGKLVDGSEEEVEDVMILTACEDEEEEAS